MESFSPAPAPLGLWYGDGDAAGRFMEVYIADPSVLYANCMLLDIVEASYDIISEEFRVFSTEFSHETLEFRHEKGPVIISKLTHTVHFAELRLVR
ncbi:hypothetical protein HanRHA438_Chr16g0788301 [Helianthus annuus]|nr:hypothetical protein HanRHA438_Chr16g0788301 [Helianthus annuus]